MTTTAAATDTRAPAAGSTPQGSPAEGSTTQVYRIFIRTTPQAIWDAITTPEWTQRFGYGLRDAFELRRGGSYRGYSNDGMLAMGMPPVMTDGEVIEADPPRRLVITWRMAVDPALAAEGHTRLTYEIEPGRDGVCRLTVLHDCTGTPGHARMVAGDRQGPGAGGGWSWILSDLKTLLESGAPMVAPEPAR